MPAAAESKVDLYFDPHRHWRAAFLTRLEPPIRNCFYCLRIQVWVQTFQKP